MSIIHWETGIYTAPEVKREGKEPYRVTIAADWGSLWDYADLMQQDPVLRGIYLNAEKETGYVRDRNVFREGIDIEDRMSVLVKYRDGATLSYHLNSFSPWEGYRLSIVGDKGRIEYEEVYSTPQLEGEPSATGKEVRCLTWLPLFELGKVIPVPVLEGGHGGGDALLQEQIFSGNPPEDPYYRSAGYQQGVASAIVGIAANHSIATGQPIEIDSLITLEPGAVRLTELTK